MSNVFSRSDITLTGSKSIAPSLDVAGRVVDQDDLVKQACTFANLRCISTTTVEMQRRLTRHA